ERRLLEREDGVVDLDAAVVPGDRAAGVRLLGGVVAREVGADHLPRLALVARAMHHLRGGVEHARVVRRDRDRLVPLEPVLHVFRLLADRELRPRRDLHLVAEHAVVTADRAAVAAGVGHLRVLRVDRHPGALAAAGDVPVLAIDAASRGARGQRHRRVVLLAAVHPVGELVVHGHAVELRRRLVGLRRPGAAAVEGDVGAAVVALDHRAGIIGRDPQVVVVTVRRAHRCEGLAAVLRLPHRGVEHVERAGVLGIGEDVRVVPGALDEVAVAVDQAEAAAAVVAAVDAPLLLVLDERPDAVRARRRDREPDAPQRAGGQALGERPPRIAAVDRLVDAAARAAGDHRPRLAQRLPHRGVEHARVRRIHRQVDGARPVAHVEHLAPAAAAVRGAEDAALRVRTERVAERRHVDDVRVLRVDADLADELGLLEPDAVPGLARVRRLVDAVAGRHVAADARRAHADVDHVGVRRRDGDRAHGGRPERIAGALARHHRLLRRRREELRHRRALAHLAHHGRLRHRLLVAHAVGDVAPGGAAVGGLPHAAARRAHVERARLPRHAGHGRRAPAAERADEAEGERVGVGRLVERRDGRGGMRPRLGGQRRAGRRVAVLRLRARSSDGDRGKGEAGNDTERSAGPDMEPTAARLRARGHGTSSWAGRRRRRGGGAARKLIAGSGSVSNVSFATHEAFIRFQRNSRYGGGMSMIGSSLPGPRARRRALALGAAAWSLAATIAVPMRAATVTVAVDAGAARHPISPYVYGVNFADPTRMSVVPYPLNRWGGNSTTRYNWKTDMHNTGSDWYFLNLE